MPAELTMCPHEAASPLVGHPTPQFVEISSRSEGRGHAQLEGQWGAFRRHPNPAAMTSAARVRRHSEPEISSYGVRVGGCAVSTGFQTEPNLTPVREGICQHMRSSVNNEKRLATR